MKKSMCFLASRKLFFRMICAIWIGSACQPTSDTAQQLTEPPNFVFILVDDLGWKDVGVYGSTFYETPYIDQIASEGMLFTNAYAACPVCSPTRASIQTGKYPVRTGITDYINPAGRNQPDQWNRNTPLLPTNYQDHLALEETTLPEVLKENGYATFFAGKWHLGGEGFFPEDHGFDINKGGIERGGPYGGNKYFSPYGNPKLEDGPEGEHLPDRLASETAQFIEEHQNQPFFAFLSFYSVHTPLMAPDSLVKKYEEKQAIAPEDSWGKEGSRKVRQVQNHAVYAGMVEAMDAAVGKVTDKLEELGLAENTVVFVMSDNGGLSTSEGHPTSNLPLRGGKGWLYEGGIREPMLVKWPENTFAGAICDQYVTSTDFFPTILEMAGITEQDASGIDGKSMVPLLQKGNAADFTRGDIFWHYPHYGNQGASPGAAIRSGDYKLILFFEKNHAELYNLSEDISEFYDLAEKQPAKASELRGKLERWLQETSAKIPSSNPNYQPDS